MLIADGGGGYGGTNWMSMDVPSMWSTIANQDTTTHYDVVGGWSKTAELVLVHLGQVQRYRDNLASVWSPEKSPAAAAYLSRLDGLIGNLKNTHEAASANYLAFSTVTLTLSLARKDLKPILDEYEANKRLNLDWQAKQDAAANSPQPTPSPSPSGSKPTPPVSSAQQEQLNNRARVIMYDLSNAVLNGHATLKNPKVYDPAKDLDTDGPDNQSDSGSGTGFAAPPVIPPPGGGTSASGSTHHSAHSASVVPINPTTTTPGGSPAPGVIGGGPILGGVGPSPVINPPVAGLPPVTTPAPSPVPPPPGLVPGIITPNGSSGLTPSSGLLPQSPKNPQSGLVKPGATGGRMAMPSGGVIGVTPGSGVIGQMPGSAPPPRQGSAVRANPVGGLIGQQGTGPAGSGGTVSRSGAIGQNASLTGSQGRGTGRRMGESEQDRWDPDNPWVTDEGVDPVVLPPREPGPIDPGPAIGYSR